MHAAPVRSNRLAPRRLLLESLMRFDTLSFVAAGLSVAGMATIGPLWTLLMGGGIWMATIGYRRQQHALHAFRHRLSPEARRQRMLGVWRGYICFLGLSSLMLFKDFAPGLLLWLVFAIAGLCCLAAVAADMQRGGRLTQLPRSVVGVG